MKSWSDTECEEIITLAGWCRVLSSQCTLKSTWSGSSKGKYAWTFDCLFFSTDGLCRDVDTGVLVMYTSLPAGEEFSSVFTCFLLLRSVCVCEKWCGVAYTSYFSVFFLFCLLLFLSCISHSPITVIFPKILCISRPRRYARHKWLIAIDVAWSVCLSAGYNREPCKNG